MSHRLWQQQANPDVFVTCKCSLENLLLSFGEIAVQFCNLLCMYRIV